MTLSRRDLAKLAGLAGVAGLGAGRVAAAGGAPAGRRPLLKPPMLEAGDRVGMVLPASLAFNASDIDRAKEQLEAIGFEVVVGAHARRRHGSFAGTDEERAADVDAMFADPAVRGIFCYRGGWGTPRILPLLDYASIRANPKVIVGYSDVTGLLNGIHRETGLVTFHGPAAVSEIRPYTLEHLRRVVMSRQPIGTLENPPKRDDQLVNRDFRIVTYRGGSARGRLVGGNLTLVAALQGTPWEVDTEGAILFLEDAHEEPNRVDRLLTQLALGGKLAAAAGIVFGYCTDCDPDGPSLSLEEIFADHFGALGVPACSGLAVGHIKEMLTLPIGVEATLDADAGTLSFAEAAVR